MLKCVVAHCAVCVNNHVMSIVHLGICVLVCYIFLDIENFSNSVVLTICIDKQFEDTKGVRRNL